MRALPPLRLGVFGKVVVATCLLLVALGGIAGLAVQTTRSATNGADKIDQEFAERVQTDTALRSMVENSGLVAQRLRAREPAQIRKLDGELARTDESLARAIGPALDGGNGVHAAEARLVGRIRKAYPGYLKVRESLLRQAGQPGSPGLRALDIRLDRAANPLRGELAAYAKVHFDEGGRALDELRSAGAGRNERLALLLAFALVSLLAVLWVARRIVVRLREYAEFSGIVAGGDLHARLGADGRDELGTLATCLNSMVEQLANSSTQRHASRAQEGAYRAAQEAFSEILQVTESEREAHDILKLHIERGVPASEVVVLNRNNSRDRLEATTDVPENSPLLESLQSAEPRSCLAVRLARPFQSAGETPSLLDCEICGASANDSTCVPLLVSGEVIGSC